jgi:hypothetical protein
MLSTVDHIVCSPSTLAVINILGLTRISDWNSPVEHSLRGCQNVRLPSSNDVATCKSDVTAMAFVAVVVAHSGRHQ